MKLLQLNNLSKWYGEVIGLNDVTASVSAGVTGLVGPNGAGKSTLMGLAVGQLRPSKGSIRVFGENPWNNPRVLGRVGFCPEGDPFWPNLTGHRFVSTLAAMSGLGGSNRGEAVLRAIDRVDMREHMNRPIRTYSKGMRQRIKIAQALVHEPDLLVLDEPFTGTDPVGRHELSQLLRSLAGYGVSILVSSHVLHEVEALTKQIILIDHGRFIAEGSVQDVRRRMHNRPHTIRVRVDHPRALAIRLAGVNEVGGLRILDDQTIVVETRTPEAIYDRLPDLILNNHDIVYEVAATDETLEALFGYLVDRSA